MLKKLIFIIFFTFVAWFNPKPIQAESDFITDISIEYDVNEQGLTLVKNNITIENASSGIQATNFILSLDDIIPLNFKAYEGDRKLNINSQKEENKIRLQVDFDTPVAGIGKIRKFTIEYEDQGFFATRTGEVWEISIPRSGGDTFRFYNVKLMVPESFGYEAYVSPTPQKIEKVLGKTLYTFEDEAKKTGVSAGFGEFQVFSFVFNYHLENPNSKITEAIIALPPDTSLQRIYYQNIEPNPSNIAVDEDGNWLAKYTLKSKERLEIMATGAVQIFASPRQIFNLDDNQLASYLKPTDYWNVNDIQIQELAKRYKTPENIYHYVTKLLSYDYERVRPNSNRFGASRALSQPESAICMEYTDLFIAMSRAAGIPAREINGYAYTENPKIQPLSLVADVLHSWPEYWNISAKTWVSVDPTWGSTTDGIDYFSKLDLRHFSFVIHGMDDSKPYPPGSYKLGNNPQKDVFVTIGTLPKEKRGKLEISTSEEGFSLLNKIIKVKIQNTGVAALYNINLVYFFDEKNINSMTLKVLPPYASYETDISVPLGFFSLKSPSQVRITADTYEVSVPINRSRIIIFQLLSFFLLLLILIIVLHLKSVIFNINRIFSKYVSKKD